MQGSRPNLAAAAACAAAIALLAPIGGWAQAPAAAVDGPAVNWQFSVSGRARPYTKGIEFISQFVSDRTGGKFVIEIGYRGRFSPDRENLEAIRLGAIDGAAMCIYALPSRTPAATALDLPFLPVGGFDQTRAVHEAFFAHPYVAGELARWNSRFFLAAVIPQHEVMGIGAPPHRIEDWKGKRLRASGNVARGLEALGVRLVPGALGATIDDMKGGRLDAIALPFSYAHTGYAVPRVAKWFTENLMPGTTNCPYVVSIKSWEKLPPQYRKLLEEAQIGAHSAMRETYARYDAEARAVFAKSGIVGIKYGDAELTRIREIAGKPFWDAWVKDMTPKGVPARQLLDLIFDTALKTKPN